MAIVIKKKSESWVIKLMDLFLRHTTGGRFMLDFWTTVGSTVYVPTKYDRDFDWGTDPWRKKHKDVLDHEQVHIDQKNERGAYAFTVLYIGPSPFMLATAAIVAFFSLEWAVYMACTAAIFSPLSVGFAYGRWRLEREAYLVNLRAQQDGALRARAVERIVDTLWHNYLYCWPRSWMTIWFKKHA